MVGQRFVQEGTEGTEGGGDKKMEDRKMGKGETERGGRSGGGYPIT